MNELEKQNTDSSEIAELREGYAELSRLVTILIAAAVVGSLTITGFIGLQSRRAGQELQATETELDQVHDSLAKQMPAVQDFAAKVAEFARGHADFQPIALKYGLTNTVASGPAPLGSKR